MSHEISKAEHENYKKNFEKHLLAGTLTDRRLFHRFPGEEIASLDLTGYIDIDIKAADKDGMRVVVITDQKGQSRQRSTCCP